MNKFKKLMNIGKRKMIKHGPDILVGTGIAGGVISAIMACKATRKIDEIKEFKEESINKMKLCLESSDIEYDEKDYKKDLTLTYVGVGKRYAKLYAPSVILGGLSIGSILTGHNMLKKRNLALMAAYSVLDNSFKKYRENVIDKFGEDVDKEMRFLKKVKVTNDIMKDDGTVETETKYIDTYDAPSEYARFFDEFSSQWSKDPEYNLMFLKKQQDYANELLQKRGYVFLNEVYESLGIPKSKEGQVVGWYYEKDNKTGDNYIDFGIYNNKNEANRLFVNGRERSILLDFNVDGSIYQKL